MKVVIFEFKSIAPFFVYDELLDKIESCIGGKYRAITKNVYVFEKLNHEILYDFLQQNESVSKYIESYTVIAGQIIEKHNMPRG